MVLACVNVHLCIKFNVCGLCVHLAVDCVHKLHSVVCLVGEINASKMLIAIKNSRRLQCITSYYTTFLQYYYSYAEIYYRMRNVAMCLRCALKIGWYLKHDLMKTAFFLNHYLWAELDSRCCSWQKLYLLQHNHILQIYLFLFIGRLKLISLEI